MSFYEDASLVLVPSGYKTSKVYSAKPTDGAGDLVFTRTADTATRVGPNGLIEKVRTNTLLQSNGFNTASWTKFASGTGLVPVITANAGTAPDGTNNAFRVQFNCVGTTSSDRSILNQTITSVNSTPHASSVYIKAFSAGEVGKQVRFITEQSSSQIIITLTADWQRVVNVGTSTSTSLNFLLETRGGFTANTAADVLLAFAQLETGDIATDYIATTSAAVSVGPVANVPRLDYLNSTCPKLLLEPQRTNLFNFSENFDNAYWSVIGSLTITANTNVSPDGYTNADRVTTTAAPARIQRAFTGLTAGTRTLSCFVKAGTGSTFRINTFDGIVDRGATFNVATGAVTSTGTGVTATITNYGNGWYRTTHNYTSAGTSYSCQFFFDDVGTYQVYGFQFEDLVSYATSYIPTLGAAVTRGADACSKTGISSLIGQTQGTIFIDFVWNNSLGDVVPFDITGSDGKLIWMRGIGAQFYGNGSTLLADISRTGAVQGTRYKIAFVYGQDDFRLYRNGSFIGADTSGTFTGTFSDIALNSVINQANGFNQILLFKTKLTNAQMQELTSL
jgi:hypothetical protein